MMSLSQCKTTTNQCNAMFLDMVRLNQAKIWQESLRVAVYEQQSIKLVCWPNVKQVKVNK